MLDVKKIKMKYIHKEILLSLNVNFYAKYVINADDLKMRSTKTNMYYFPIR